MLVLLLQSYSRENHGSVTLLRKIEHQQREDYLLLLSLLIYMTQEDGSLSKNRT